MFNQGTYPFRLKFFFKFNNIVVQQYAVHWPSHILFWNRTPGYLAGSVWYTEGQYNNNHQTIDNQSAESLAQIYERRFQYLVDP